MLIESKLEFVTKCGSVRFIPGLKEISADGVDYLKKDKYFDEKVRLGLLVVIEAEGKSGGKKASEELTLSKLTQSKALEVIKSLYDRAKLKALIETEKRPKVLGALSAQLSMLNTSDENPHPEKSEV